MRRLFTLLTLACAFGLGACAAPAPGNDTTQPPPIAAAPAPAASSPAPLAAVSESAPANTLPEAPKPRSKPAPPMSDPLPPEREPEAKPAQRRAVAKLDISCQRDADCAVKNVGNCCGVQPRCVNVNAKVDPNAVQEQCARTGMASVCGFKPVESCECKQGQCHDKLMMVESQ